MSKIKGYTAEELAQIKKDGLIEDYASCKRKLAEIVQPFIPTESGCIFC